MRFSLEIEGAGKSLERKLLERYRALTSASEVEIGFFPEHVHPESGVPVAQVAWWNEVGNTSQNRPPRPFFKYSVATFSMEWADVIRVSLKATGYDAKAALTAVGQLAALRIQSVIKSWSEPPNAKATVRSKGFNDPLVDTGYMLHHVTYKVNTK